MRNWRNPVGQDCRRGERVGQRHGLEARSALPNRRVGLTRWHNRVCRRARLLVGAGRVDQHQRARRARGQRVGLGAGAAVDSDHSFDSGISVEAICQRPRSNEPAAVWTGSVGSGSLGSGSFRSGSFGSGCARRVRRLRASNDTVRTDRHRRQRYYGAADRWVSRT